MSPFAAQVNADWKSTAQKTTQSFAKFFMTWPLMNWRSAQQARVANELACTSHIWDKRPDQGASISKTFALGARVC
jgi:hypothetical protein